MHLLALEAEGLPGGHGAGGETSQGRGGKKPVSLTLECQLMDPGQQAVSVHGRGCIVHSSSSIQFMFPPVITIHPFVNLAMLPSVKALFP